MFDDKRIELVHFQITRNCNLRCWFCGQWGKKGFFSGADGEEMTFADWQKVTHSLIQYKTKTGNCPNVILWGGEPLVCKDFGNIAKMLYDNGFELAMVTNGVLIDKWADVINKYFKRIYLSIDGNKDVHNSIRGEGVFEKALSNIKLIDKRVERIIMTVVTQSILDDLQNLPFELEQFEPNELYLQPLICLSKQEIDDYKHWFNDCFGRQPLEIDSWQMDISDDFFAKRQEKLELVRNTQYPFKVTVIGHADQAKREYCLSPFRHIHIAWNGNVLYCTDFYDFCAGNVKQQDVIDIFNNNLSDKYREQIKNKNCATCNHCSWRNNQSFKF